MDYYKTSPEYIKIKVGEQQLESVKKRDLLKMSLAVMLIVGMTFCALTAFHLSKSKPFLHLFDKSDTEGMNTYYHPTTSTEAAGEEASEDTWVMIPYRLVVIHIYNPLFACGSDTGEEDGEGDIPGGGPMSVEEMIEMEDNEYYDEESTMSSSSSSASWGLEQGDLAYFAAIQDYLASVFQFN